MASNVKEFIVLTRYLFYMFTFTLSIAACVPGAASSPSEHPDLIEERAGDLSRFYFLNKPPSVENAWPNAHRTYYYLSHNLKVEVESGKRIQLPMSQQEHDLVTRTIQELHDNLERQRRESGTQRS
jgi:hypothetical protein